MGPTKFDVDKVSIPAKMSTNARVKPGQLWSKGRDDLKKQLDELKTELGQLRVQKIAGGASSQINLPSPHCHQRQPTTPTAPVLRKEEVPPSRSSTKANSCHSPTIEQEGRQQNH